jgi:hypothetical protein
LTAPLGAAGGRGAHCADPIDASLVKSASIIITNHNYARFLPEAIASALAQTHPACEVIVVDDGSTDDSRAVLERFPDVCAIFQENRGQAGAFNAGLRQASGDAIIFLDADDRLEPGTAALVADVLDRHPSVAKVMYRLRVIAEDGTPTGEVKPIAHVPVRTGDLRPYVLRFPFDMPWMATTGNAFPAAALAKIFPIPEADYPLGADWYLSNLTPLLGEVAFLDEIGGSYRVHAANRYERTLGGPGDLDQVRQTIVYGQRTARHIREFAAQAGVAPQPEIDETLISVSNVWQRMLSLRLDPDGHPVGTDTRLGLLMLGIRGARRRFDVAIPLRLLLGAWVVTVAFAPRAILPELVRIVSLARHQGPLTRVLGQLHYRRVQCPRG